MILLVMALWGLNFVFVRIGLNGVPPLLLCALRFLLAGFPAILIIKKPACSWKILIAYGLVMFALQFSLLFSGMKVGMSPALASLLMQVQVFFSMGMAAWIFKEKSSLWKIVGALISFSGIVYVGLHTQSEITNLGIYLTLAAAFSWGTGNIISKKIGNVQPLALVVWGSFVATPVLIGLSIVVDGPDLIRLTLQNLAWPSIAAIGYITYFSTYIAYSLWSFLLTQYPTPTVAPFTLLIPVFGFLGSFLFLDEKITTWKIIAAMLVVSGLCFNLLESKIRTGFRILKKGI